MPIIEVPFDHIALDIVGPLPKTSRGHRYILFIVDYATRYPETLPLRAATAASRERRGRTQPGKGRKTLRRTPTAAPSRRACAGAFGEGAGASRKG